MTRESSTPEALTATDPMSPLESVLMPIAQELDLDAKSIVKGLQDGLTFAQILGLGTEALETIYSAAFAQLSAGRIHRAKRLFEALTLLEPHTSHYWLGLAISLRASGNHEDTLPCLDAAEALAPDWAPVHFHRLETMILLHRWDLAKKALIKFEASPKHGISTFMIKQASRFSHALGMKKG